MKKLFDKCSSCRRYWDGGCIFDSMDEDEIKKSLENDGEREYKYYVPLETDKHGNN